MTTKLRIYKTKISATIYIAAEDFVDVILEADSLVRIGDTEHFDVGVDEAYSLSEVDCDHDSLPYLASSCRYIDGLDRKTIREFLEVQE